MYLFENMSKSLFTFTLLLDGTLFSPHLNKIYKKNTPVSLRKKPLRTPLKGKGKGKGKGKSYLMC